MFSRRHFLTTVASVSAALKVRGSATAGDTGPTTRSDAGDNRQDRPRPSRAQLEWQRDELALFLHFGVNTFTDREWGDGKEAPAIFNPTALDAGQWARVAKAGGAKALILTAKHHDGFCLWPTKTTAHSVASSPFRGGRGDVVREFVDACTSHGLKAGLYLSPWDRHAAVYGDSPRYNAFYREQLTELLTQYGRIDEVWFDGANGEGPNGKKQEYDWPSTWALVRQLQPEAVMFSDAGPDVRWIGNENGVAGETNWSTVVPEVVPAPGVSGAAVMKMLREGDPNGTVWRPGETDVSIRPGWFHHPAEDAKVRSVDNLVNLYFTSVGRNSKLLLNVPPTREGLIHVVDAERLAGMRARLLEMRVVDDLVETSPMATDGIALDLGRVVRVSFADIRERIDRGQAIAGYVVEGSLDGLSWQTLSSGTTVGYRKLDRFSPVDVRWVRVKVTKSIGTPALGYFTARP